MPKIITFTFEVQQCPGKLLRLRVGGNGDAEQQGTEIPFDADHIKQFSTAESKGQGQQDQQLAVTGAFQPNVR